MKAIAVLVLAFCLLGAALPCVFAAGWNPAETWTLSIPPTSYTYTINGPLLETGLVYNGLVNVTVSFADLSPVSFTLDGTGGGAETQVVATAVPASSLRWNISDTYNRSRTISFCSTSHSDEVNIYVPGSSDILGQYSISVTDFAGLSNAMVETDRNIVGYNRIIERQVLDTTNPMYFWLLAYQQYTLKIVSDEVTLTWSLPADSVLDKNYVVTRDMIPSGDTTQNATVTATRSNGTYASVFYSDPTLSTSSVTSTISLHNITGYFVFYSQTDAGNVQNYTLNTLDASADYVCLVTATQGGSVIQWSFSLSRPASSTDYFATVFDSFTTDPTLRNIMVNGFGMFTVLAFIALGSWSDSEWFMGAAIVVACVLAFNPYAKLLTIPYAGIASALMVVVFMYIHRGKQETREF